MKNSIVKLRENFEKDSFFAKMLKRFDFLPILL